MDVRYSPEQQELRASVARAVDRLGPHTVSDLDDAERRAKLDAAVRASGWRELRDAASADGGGPLASGVEAAIVAEELGRGPADVAYVGPTLAAELRRRAGAAPADAGETVALGPDLASLAVVDGDVPPAAVAIDAAGAESALVLSVDGAGGGYRLGRVALQPRAIQLDLTRLTAAVDVRSPIAAVDMTPPSATVDMASPQAAADVASPQAAADVASPQAAADVASPQAAADVASPQAAADVASPQPTAGYPAGVCGPDDLAAVVALGLSLTCAELVGVMGGAIALACDYASTRRQYDAPVGSFQSLQHLLADAYVAMEGSRSVALHAAWAVDALAPTEALAAASLAKAYCARAARNVCEVAVQVHGGIGNTWDCMAHVFLRRALLSSELFGGEGMNLERVLAHHGAGVHGLR